jgi:hypothetical protein
MKLTKGYYHFVKYSLCCRQKKYRINLVQNFPINRDPIRPCFHSAAPVLWAVKSSIPVSHKILLRMPNIMSFTKS